VPGTALADATAGADPTAVLECNLWMGLESQRTKGTAEEDIRLY